MKKLLSFFLLLTFDLGCGPLEPDLEVDEGLNAAFELYYQNAPTRGRIDTLISIKYGTPVEGENLAGICNVQKRVAFGHTYRKTRTVVIKPYPGYPLTESIATLHELGHCIHGLEHHPEPGNIMSKSMDRYDTTEGQEFLEAYWQENRLAKLKEMFLDVR